MIYSSITQDLANTRAPSPHHDKRNNNKNKDQQEVAFQVIKTESVIFILQ